VTRKKKNKLPPVRRFEMGASLHNETFLLNLGYKITRTMRYIKVETAKKTFFLQQSEFYKFVDKIRVENGYEPIIKPRS